MSEILVQIEQGERAYSHGKTPVVAVSSATCQIRSGDRIALMGPSGSGKSTLLHVLGGLDGLTAGTIRWPALGERATLRPIMVGLVFQMPSLLAPLTVVENVELPLLLGQASAGKARAAALAALERIGLRFLAEKLPEELSGGQAQRVAIARALASQPKLLLADEPTGQLDHSTAQQVFDVLLTSLEGSETALVVATHDKAVAERMRTLWHMDHGILEVNESC
jgi:lipoprotein-releasing system ATP-binding protein